MDSLIGRSSNGTRRVFPPIGANLYATPYKPTELTPDQRVAHIILSLANKDFSPMERFWGWKLDAPGQIARLLLMHKLGIEAEVAGKWQRADHFWSFVREQMKALAGRTDVWEDLVKHVASRPQVSVLNDPVQLRQHLVDEILIDTHCAFYNAYVQEATGLTWESRAFLHLDYIKGFIEFSALSRDDLTTLLGPASEKWITLCEEAKQGDQALRVCADLLNYLPDLEDYQDRLIKLHLVNTMSKLKNAKSPNANLKDAKTLQAGIDRLEQMRQDIPYSIATFDALGVLYHQRAISLANGKRLSEAILSAQKAVTYSPHLQQAQATRDALIQTMQRLQAQMQAVQAELARRPRARLSPEGVQLAKEAQQGLGPLSDYIASDEARKVAEAFYAAQGRGVWRDIGLAKPTDDWNERARALLVGLSSVIRQPPDSPDGLAATWGEVIAEQEDLADLDAAPICAYLERRLFSGDQDQEDKAAPEAYAFCQNPPVMRGVSSKRRRGGEPFLFWLFSGQDKRIKLQAVVAIALILLVGGLTVRDLSVRQARTGAYNQIIEAAKHQDYLSIIQGSEAFFAATPLSGNDSREEQVVNLYNQAFVLWFVGLEGEPGADALAHIEHYQALIVDSGRQGGNQP